MPKQKKVCSRPPTPSKQGDHGCACKQCFPPLVLRPGLKPGKVNTSCQLCGTGKGWTLLELHYAGQEATIATFDSLATSTDLFQANLKKNV